jgi:hypothetical protein
MSRNWYRNKICLKHGIDGHTFKSSVVLQINPKNDRFLNPDSDFAIMRKEELDFSNKEIAMAHECIWLKIFNPETDFVGKQGFLIDAQASRALEILFGLGVEPAPDDDTNPNSSWGLTSNGAENMDEKSLMAVFARKLGMLRRLAREYPDAYFVHDESEYVELVINGKKHYVNLYEGDND